MPPRVTARADDQADLARASLPLTGSRPCLNLSTDLVARTSSLTSLEHRLRRVVGVCRARKEVDAPRSDESGRTLP